MTSRSRRLADLTPEQQQIVQLIAAGYARWAIAVKMDLDMDASDGENYVRDEIRKICAIVGGNRRIQMLDLPGYFGLPMLGDDDDGEIRVM